MCTCAQEAGTYQDMRWKLQEIICLKFVADESWVGGKLSPKGFEFLQFAFGKIILQNMMLGSVLVVHSCCM